MRPLIALLLFIAAGACNLSVSTPRSYENYSVYKVFIKTRSDQQVIDQLLEQTDNVSFTIKKMYYLFLYILYLLF